jgi:hypothetical protein
MKVIISHDVDHINASDHFTDLFLPKFFIRNVLELFNKDISWSEFNKRIQCIFKNKFNNVSELIKFDRNNHVKPTFFVAVSKGLGISYDHKKAGRLLHRLMESNVPISVHGIAFSKYNEIYNEFEQFKEITGLDFCGIRMHYLRTDYNTLSYLNNAGYIFDSSVYSLKNPYKEGDLWEFPIHLMDTFLFYGNSKYKTKPAEILIKETIELINNAGDSGIEYFNVITHDFYFSDSFLKWKNWYIWLIGYLKNNGYEFINFDNAVSLLNTTIDPD